MYMTIRFNSVIVITRPSEKEIRNSQKDMGITFKINNKTSSVYYILSY